MRPCRKTRQGLKKEISMKPNYYALASEDNNHEKPKRKENKKKLRDNRRDTRSSMKRKIGRRGRR